MSTFDKTKRCELFEVSQVAVEAPATAEGGCAPQSNCRVPASRSCGPTSPSAGLPMAREVTDSLLSHSVLKPVTQLRFAAPALLAGLLFWPGLAIAGFAAAWESRPIPEPLTNHPGNIFLEDQEVRLQLPAGAGPDWTAFDFEGKRTAAGRVIGGVATVGRLPVGYYEVGWSSPDSSNRVAAGVLARLKAPTPTTSPICLDVALGWFFKEHEMAPVINLGTLAGINWVRDRYTWMEMEFSPGGFSKPNRYDASVRAQAEAGLRVLEVNHYSPLWANTNQLRFPLDLRETFRLHRELARRWSNFVQAFEPWNEADIDGFGHHTGSEIASFQKAAYLGIKAGHPRAIAGQAAFASHNPAMLRDFFENQPWPYFDTFNLHHYIEPEAYSELYAAFRRSATGRPLWVTECNQPVHWSGDDKLEEPSAADLRVQAERVARMFATSLHQGAANVFYFTLTHYAEGQNQFGLLRRDLTPRPAYLALAAAGRLLADASPFGRWTSTLPNLRAFLFRARPDGQSNLVLVAWSIEGRSIVPLPIAPRAVFDFLGRPQPVAGKSIMADAAPVFAVFPASAAKLFALEPLPRRTKPLGGEPSPIVFQAVWPENRVLHAGSAYQIAADRPSRIPVFAYNFSSNVVEGRLRSSVPTGWKITLPDRLRLAPDERQEIAVSIHPAATRSLAAGTFRIDGLFGENGRAVLSLPLRPGPASPPESGQLVSISAADDPARWTLFVSGSGAGAISLSEQGVTVHGKPRTGNRWIYPRFELRDGESLREPIDAVQVKLTLLEGTGTFRVIFEEPTGAAYMADFDQQPKPGQTVETIALVERVSWGATWSMPDQNGRLDLPGVKSIRIGCNTKGDSVKFAIKELRWVRFSQ